MIYNIQIKFNQFISAIGLLLGITFALTVLSIGSLDNWVCYLVGLFSILFIISAPLYLIGWKLSKNALAIAFILFICYNIYNTISSSLEGNNDTYIGIPISISSLLIVLSLLDINVKPLNLLKTYLSPIKLFLESAFTFWIWLFIEMFILALTDKSIPRIYTSLAAAWFLVMTMFTVGVYLDIITRLPLSILLHLQLTMIICYHVYYGIHIGLFIPVVCIHLIMILFLHSKSINQTLTIACSERLAAVGDA